MSSRSSRTIYVGNLPGDIRLREVDDLFYKYGSIVDIDLKIPPRPPGYAFVEFSDARDAEDAIRGRDGYNFDGYRLRVELAHGGRRHSSSVDRYSSYSGSSGGRGPSRRSDYRVLVTGLPPSASWQDLKDHMRKAGDVCFSQVFRDRGGMTGIVDYTNKTSQAEPTKNGRKVKRNRKLKKERKKPFIYIQGKEMALNITHQIGALTGKFIPGDVSAVAADSTASVNTSAVWRPAAASLRCKMEGPEATGSLSPPLSPLVLGATRPDLSVACQAFAMAETVTEEEQRTYREGGVGGKGKGVPVYVMMPLDSVTMGNTVNRRKAMNASLQALKSAGVEGVMMDVWWGLVEREAPGTYNWGGYTDLLEMARKHGLKVQAVMSFHRCGGNVGDSCTIPLPKWVVEEIDRDHDLAYTDQWGRRNYEYVSLGCDTLPVLKGRTPVQCYADFMRAFRDNFKHLLGHTILEIQVGMGPAGELRYPSYPEQNGTWRFPGIGAFQCYDKYMLSSLKAAAEAAGKPEWGSTGPTDAGHYNNWPEDTQFFRKEGGGWNGPYGEFFLSWYSQMLLEHGERILSSAKSVFGNTGVKISVKIAGIHWHYGTRSHAPELTAGYYNTRFRDGYLPIAQMLARHGAIFNFTCIEMRDHEQPQDALCAPEKLVRQVALATQAAGVPLAGENALPRYDEYAHEQILQASSLNIDGNREGDREMCAFTYLRMNPDLFQPDNWRRFVAFVKKMKEGKGAQRCWEEVEREAEHFVHVTQPLVQEAAVALMH